jgi:hypothetical protein
MTNATEYPFPNDPLPASAERMYRWIEITTARPSRYVIVSSRRWGLS